MADPLNTAFPSSESDAINFQALFVDGINLRTANQNMIQNYVCYVVQTYIDDNMEDERLWEGIHFDFEDFTEEHFKRLNTSTKTWNLLRDYCYAHGFWIDYDFGNGKTRASTMLQAVNADWHDKWTMEQIQWVERRYHNLFPMILERKQELIGATNSLTNTANPSIASTVPATLSAVPPPAPVTPHSSVTPPVSLVQPTFNKPQQPQPHHNVNSQPQSQNVRFSRQATPLSIPDQTLNEHDTSTQWSRELVLLDKIYKDDDKFSGTGDNFVFKVNIYYDKCRRVGLPPNAYLQGASIMLSGQAQTYHYSNQGDTSFDGFCVKMRLFFEGPEWQRLNLTKWQTVSLNNTISANPTLTTTECLCQLCTNLETIQRGLDPAYYGPVHLRENIIRACRGHPALADGLTNPPPDTSGLVNNLYTFERNLLLTKVAGIL